MTEDCRRSDPVKPETIPDHIVEYLENASHEQIQSVIAYAETLEAKSYAEKSHAQHENARVSCYAEKPEITGDGETALEEEYIEIRNELDTTKGDESNSSRTPAKLPKDSSTGDDTSGGVATGDATQGYTSERDNSVSQSDSHDLPDGVPANATVTVKEINNNRYYYWQWRDGEKIRSKYKGPVNNNE